MRPVKPFVFEDKLYKQYNYKIEATIPKNISNKAVKVLFERACNEFLEKRQNNMN